MKTTCKIMEHPDPRLLRRFIALPFLLLSVAATALGIGDETAPQSKTLPQVPAALIGNWSVVRRLPTFGITCWSSQDARFLLGKRFELKSESLLWQHNRVPTQSVRITTFDDESFFKANSGSGGGEHLRELGVSSPTVQVVEIQHPDIKWKDPSGQDHYEIPGDWALLKAPNTIVVSVCNVYYEARRLPPVKQH
jgi:hypothetical protein